MKVLRLVPLALVLAACSSVNVPISPYRIDVQQGNALEQEAVEKLKLGMSRSQVRFLLGTPLLVDPFHGNRWDYVYNYRKAGKLTEQRRLVLFFEGDVLSRVEAEGLKINPEPLEAKPAQPPRPVAEEGPTRALEAEAPLVAEPLPAEPSPVHEPAPAAASPAPAAEPQAPPPAPANLAAAEAAPARNEAAPAVAPPVAAKPAAAAEPVASAALPPAPVVAPAAPEPASQPSAQPSTQPASQPASQPSAQPAGQPSAQPSTQPASQPSAQPSTQPASQPSAQPAPQDRSAAVQSAAAEAAAAVAADKRSMDETSVVRPLRAKAGEPAPRPAAVAATSPEPVALQPEADVEAIKPDVMPEFPDTLPDTASAESELTAALDVWAEAWRSRNEDAYLAAYAPTFRPAGGLSRSEWEARRRMLLRISRNIDLRIEGVTMESITEDHAQISFRQYYRSDTYQDAVRKQLKFVRIGDKWLIEEENVLGLIGAGR